MVPTSSSETTAAAPQQSGSMWMPLMAGYMMGRMMGGGASQPLFTSKAPNSPANGKFVDASGKNFGAATTGRTMTVPKTALAPKPAVTKLSLVVALVSPWQNSPLCSVAPQHHPKPPHVAWVAKAD